MMLAMMKNWMCGLRVCLLTLACHGAALGQGLAESLLAESPDSLISAVGQLGDPVRGALVFYRAELNCHKCHEANQRGRALGPDLSQQRPTNITEMVESILSPSAKIRMGFESQVFLLEDGRQLTGVVVSEDDEVVVLDRIEEADQPLRLDVNEIVDRKRASVSMMPIGLANQLSDRQEFLDLICYLVEIAARGPTRAAQLRPATSSIALAPLPAYESSVDHQGLIASWDANMLEQGAQVFKLRCASCHGDLLAEGTMPTSLRFPTGKFKHGADPFSMYQTLTHGYGMMIPQRWMVPEEKYAVIHYIRETFLKDPNPSQYFPVDESYLAALPKGDTRGPKPVSSQPWTAMNYGPSLINTIEVPGDQTNIAQKGIAIRLDSGPGGVESGRYWMMYDHDTMRMAAAWSGSFIDYEGIHFNGAHGRHPTATGVVHFQNPDGPGWGRPVDGTFVDDRVRGRDDRQYGPLPRSWAQYRGLYRHGDQTIVQYTIDQTTVLESPGIRFAAGVPTYVRTLNLGPRKRDLILQVTRSSQPFSYRDGMLVTDDRPDQQLITVVGDKLTFDVENWLTDDAGNVRLRVPAGDQPLRLCIQMASLGAADDRHEINKNHLAEANLNDLLPLTKGGSRNWPEVLETEIQSGPETGAYVVDVLTHPVENPYHCRLRLTGLDFIPGEDAAVVSTWDGSVWRVSGIGQASGKLKWTRIAAGLFQPLGIKWKKEGIFVTCRDQLVSLHDLNGDGEMDWYECFNNDHQVTEHFHEFAMGLQTDAAGNFYYAKSARHALTAVVPHHGTLLKVSADGQQTEIVANGFRAANGVCINPDGSFVVTDQEGHWNPKNRINWVRPGGFYGNMFGYHNVTDDSDDAMVPPLCWITNAFDRSPAELLWVDSNRWGPLGGALLNFSYGNGRVFVVPHEEVSGTMQGGMCALDLPAFPTGIMRGRFNPQDGQLYCCGMFAWSSTQEQPGGLYRVRYVGGPANLPIGLQASEGQIKLTFSDPLDADSAATSTNYAIRIWGLKRTANYGSEHFDERELKVETAALLNDGKTVILKVPSLIPTWCMEIVYVLKDAQGRRIENKIHNTIHQLDESATAAKTQSLDKIK